MSRQHTCRASRVAVADGRAQAGQSCDLGWRQRCVLSTVRTISKPLCKPRPDWGPTGVRVCVYTRTVVGRTLHCLVLSFGLYTNLFVQCVHCLPPPAFVMVSIQRSQVTPHSFSPGPSPGSPPYPHNHARPSLVSAHCQPHSCLLYSTSVWWHHHPRYPEQEGLECRTQCPYSPSEFGRPDFSLPSSQNS